MAEAASVKRTARRNVRLEFVMRWFPFNRFEIGIESIYALVSAS
jgi:hypothetical protein